MLNRKKNLMLASSYDKHWLVYVNLLQVARVKTFDEIDTSKMNEEQLKEWNKLKDDDKVYLKKLFAEKIEKNKNTQF